jgi:hypothetical protein
VIDEPRQVALRSSIDNSERIQKHFPLPVRKEKKIEGNNNFR